MKKTIQTTPRITTVNPAKLSQASAKRIGISPAQGRRGMRPGLRPVRKGGK